MLANDVRSPVICLCWIQIGVKICSDSSSLVIVAGVTETVSGALRWISGGVHQVLLFTI